MYKISSFIAIPMLWPINRQLASLGPKGLRKSFFHHFSPQEIHQYLWPIPTWMSSMPTHLSRTWEVPVKAVLEEVLTFEEVAIWGGYAWETPQLWVPRAHWEVFPPRWVFVCLFFRQNRRPYGWCPSKSGELPVIYGTLWKMGNILHINWWYGFLLMSSMNVRGPIKHGMSMGTARHGCCSSTLPQRARSLDQGVRHSPTGLGRGWSVLQRTKKCLKMFKNEHICLE